MKGLLKAPAKVTVVVEMPKEDGEAVPKKYEYVFTGLTHASMEHQAHTRPQTIEEQMADGFSPFVKQVVTHHSFDLHLTMRPQEQP